MFDKFGEFDSVEELNKAAEGLLKEGDLESLRALAEENGIDCADTEDYIDGIVPELATVLMAAVGRMDVEQREIEKISNPMERKGLLNILSLTRDEAKEETMAKAVMKKGKRISGIQKAMYEEAYKNRTGNWGLVCGTDRELCGIIKAYYLGSEEEFRQKIADLYK